MPSEEQEFITQLEKELKRIFKFKHFEILDGKGIIIQANKIY
jgi:SPX domain protein involved in polyphosphate accumulation